MAEGLVVGALVAVIFLLSAVILLVSVLRERAEKAWADERTRLLNLVVAQNPREFKVLQKAGTPKPEKDPEAPPEPVQIGMG